MTSPENETARPRLVRRRLGLLALAYVAGTFVTVSILPLVGGATDLLAPRFGFSGDMALLYFIGIASGGLAYLFALLFGFLPALFWMAASERHGVRHALAHVIAGGAGAVAGWVLLSFVAEMLGDRLLWRVAGDLFIAGCAGGLAYWAIAGRRAGTPGAAEIPPRQQSFDSPPGSR